MDNLERFQSELSSVNHDSQCNKVAFHSQILSNEDTSVQKVVLHSQVVSIYSSSCINTLTGDE